MNPHYDSKFLDYSKQGRDAILYTAQKVRQSKENLRSRLR